MRAARADSSGSAAACRTLGGVRLAEPAAFVEGLAEDALPRSGGHEPLRAPRSARAPRALDGRVELVVREHRPDTRAGSPAREERRAQ